MKLTPTTAQLTRRYSPRENVSPAHVAILPGLLPLNDTPGPAYLPPHWTSNVHPEGQLYFAHSAEPSVVTETYLYTSELMDGITSAIQLLEAVLSERKRILPSSVETFLELSEDQQSCAYYMADHETRSIFWLDFVPTDELNIPPVVSRSHLDQALEELYWNHLEYFPDNSGGLTAANLDNLTSILMHGRADRMTSDYSTFPYTAEQCQDFINMLKTSRPESCHTTTSHITCFAARVWGVVVNHRFITHAGEKQTRLSRNQRILDSSTLEPSPRLQHLSSNLSWGVSDVYHQRLNDLYVDEIVYIDQWNNFTNKSAEDWKTAIAWAAPSLVASVVLSVTPFGSPFLALFAALVNAMGIFTAILLSTQQEKIIDVGTTEVAAHLVQIRSETQGYLPAALLYSLPKALCLWGLGLLMFQVYVTMLRTVCGSAALPVAFASFMIAYGIRHAITRTFSSKPTQVEDLDSSDLPVYTTEKEVLALA